MRYISKKVLSNCRYCSENHRLDAQGFKAICNPNFFLSKIFVVFFDSQFQNQKSSPLKHHYLWTCVLTGRLCNEPYLALLSWYPSHCSYHPTGEWCHLNSVFHCVNSSRRIFVKLAVKNLFIVIFDFPWPQENSSWQFVTGEFPGFLL